VPTVLIRFKGGPLGGEEREYDRSLLRGPRLLVPALMPTSAFWRDGLGRDEPLHLPFQPEEYELRPSNSTYNVYEAQWVHPQERIILENEKLKRRIAELEDLEEVLIAFKKIKRFVG
jgi:hypothetical protein